MEELYSKYWKMSSVSNFVLNLEIKRISKNSEIFPMSAWSYHRGIRFTIIIIYFELLTLNSPDYTGIKSIDWKGYDFPEVYIYTECPRKNVSDFGRVYLMLKYADITRNTYIES
jgi:hypothetical protein